MRRLLALLAAAFALTTAPAVAQEAPVCVANADAALTLRLAREQRWSDDPAVGAMNMRMARFNISAHTRASLLQGLARYRTAHTAALITYASDAESCVWLVSASGVEAYARSARSETQIRADVTGVVRALQVEGQSRARAPRAPGGARPMSPQIIDAPFEQTALAAALAPIAETLTPAPIAAALARFDAVIVAPDQSLAGFPFSLMPDGAGGYLIMRASIELAPALSEIGLGAGLHRNQEAELSLMSPAARRATLGRALVVGDPTFADTRYVMPQLEGAAREADRVAQELGVVALKRDDATLAAVNGALNQAGGVRYLHFATHGVSDTSVFQNQSFLALAGGDRFGVSQAGTTRLRDAIIVLSACQSGLGAPRPGGIIGLPRTLQIAGAQTVVMSLWNVDDAATSALMQAFVARLIEHGRAATAFAEAVRQVREVYPDPSDWASFEVFSTAQP